MNKKLSISIAAIAASLLMLIAGGVANATSNDALQSQAPNPGKEQRQERREAKLGNILVGKVQNMDGSTITLGKAVGKNGNDGASVTTNASTTFYVPGVSSPTIANIKAGDRVSVLLAPKADTSSTDQRIALAVSVLPRHEVVIAGGEVSGITSTSFTLTGRKDNTGTVNASDAKIVVPGKSGATIGDVQNGDRVIVQGNPTGDKTVTANLIVVVPDNRDNIFGGIIAAINGNSLVVFTRDGQQLKVDASSAVIFEKGNANATVSDLGVGRPVAVIGIKNADDSVTAQLVGQVNLPLLGVRNR